MSEVVRKTFYDPNADRLITTATQDVEPYLRRNAALRAAAPEHGKYKGAMTRAASVPLVVIELMQRGQCCADGKRYNLLSADVAERRRALMHIQSEHKHLLTVNGTPFAKRRVKWQ